MFKIEREYPLNDLTLRQKVTILVACVLSHKVPNKTFWKIQEAKTSMHNLFFDSTEYA